MADRATLALVLAIGGIVAGIVILLAAAVWYLILNPEPWALAVVGVGTIVIGTFAAVLVIPSPHEVRFPPPPPDPFKDQDHDR